MKKECESIDIKREQEVYKLSYCLTEIADDDLESIERIYRRSSKIEEEPPNMGE
jgi:hypothetical protein